MRRIAGGVLLLLALLAIVTGAAMAIILGPDGRAVTGPHAVDADGVAVVTEPGVVSWAGPKVTVLAEVPDHKPVFVGVGNSVDVEDYVGDTKRLSVDSYRVPWQITTSHKSGKANLPASPTALDWWIADDAGLGGASTTFRLPDETVSLAILSVGASDLKGLRVTTSYDVRGGFGIGLGAVAAGLGTGVLGWLMVRERPFLRRDEADRWPGPEVVVDEWDDEWDNESDPAEPDEGAEPPAPAVAGTPGGEFIEEVVYVYVDEDGVEHEIPPEEAHDYEVVDDSEPVPETGGKRHWWRRG